MAQEAVKVSGVQKTFSVGQPEASTVRSIPHIQNTSP